MAKKTLIISLILLAVGISACAGIEPAKYHNDRESMEGPGLISGEKGEFTIEILRNK